ncbi:unnamed protein product, partial [marine sediment metagenome]
EALSDMQIIDMAIEKRQIVMAAPAMPCRHVLRSGPPLFHPWVVPDEQQFRGVINSADIKLSQTFIDFSCQFFAGKRRNPVRSN